MKAIWATILASLTLLAGGIGLTEVDDSLGPVLETTTSLAGPQDQERRRDTCWRTNRHTRQKFRIC